MTDHERAILMSFLEARPAYLRAYFDEIDRLYGSFAATCARGCISPTRRSRASAPGGLERAPENACALEADSPKLGRAFSLLPVQMPVRPRNGRLRLAITGSNWHFLTISPLNWHRAGP